MFNHVLRATESKVLELPTHIDYYERTTEEKIHILDYLLDDSFEIYYRNSGGIMLYNTISGDYIDENGVGACNLPLFLGGLFKEHHKSHSMYINTYMPIIILFVPFLRAGCNCAHCIIHMAS
jgi:hypothetical protein